MTLLKASSSSRAPKPRPENVIIHCSHNGISDSHGQDRGQGRRRCCQRSRNHRRVPNDHLASQGFTEGTRHSKTCQSEQLLALPINGLPAQPHSQTSFTIMTWYSTAAVCGHEGIVGKTATKYENTRQKSQSGTAKTVRTKGTNNPQADKSVHNRRKS